MSFLRGSRRRALLEDDAGVRAVYSAHGPELYRFVLRALGDEGTAEEITQEVFLRAWRAADRYDPAISSLRVWLFAIARNAVIDHRRAARARPETTPLEEAALGEAHGLVEDQSDGVMRAWIVEEALGRLQEDHRHAIVETYIRDRSHEEVAAELQIPMGTLRSRVFYGLKALRTAMDEMGVTS